MKKSEALQQRKNLIKLIKDLTRVEIEFLFSNKFADRFDNLKLVEYANNKIEVTNKIREEVFGESELAVLAERWGLTKEKPRRPKMKQK